jgi:ammonium transporter, Amt family
VAVHGACGLWSLLAVGIFASGYSNAVGPDVSLGGQAVGAVTFLALGFIPGWAVSKVLAATGLLRVPQTAEIAGLDLSEIPASAFPEGVPPTAVPRIEATALAHSNGASHDTPAPEPAAT